MLQQFGVTTAIRYLIAAMFAVAIYKGFNGDWSAMSDKVIEIVMRGAQVITDIWNQVFGSDKKA